MAVAIDPATAATAAAFERLRGDSITTPDQVTLREQWFETRGLMDVYLAVSTGHEVMIYDAIRRAERSWPAPTRYDGTAETRPGGAHLYWTGTTWIEQDQSQISVGEYWRPLPPAAPSEVWS